MNKLCFIKLTVLSVILSVTSFAFSEETNVQKVEIEKSKAVDSAKESYRNAKDEFCELVNGKMECAMKKARHKMKTLTERTETKIKEIKHQN